MPHSYAPQYREMVLAQIRDGRTVTELAAELEVSAATIFRWRKQARIDGGTA
jgi:transposase-like protein